MASSKKKRDVDDAEVDESAEEFDEDDMDSGDDEDEEEPMEEQVEMDFEARIPEDLDFHGMRTLLQQVFLKANIDISELTNTIISQNYVGSIVKQPYVPDDEDDDDSDDTVLALTTVINMTERKDLSCVKQITSMLLEKCEKCSKAQCEKLAKLFNDPDHHLGYLINERFLNLPPNMALPLLESLVKEMEKACKKNMKYKFHYYLMIAKTFQLKGAGPKEDMFYSNSEEELFQEVQPKQDMFYSNSEEELFQEVAELTFSYSVAHERDSGVEKWSSGDAMEPFRTVIIFPADKLRVVIDKIKDELATSGT